MGTIVIHNTRLPVEVERGAVFGPLFNTVVHRTDGGQVSTNQNWEFPLCQGNMAYGIQKFETLQASINFFWARRGRFYGFLLRDWSDFRFTNQILGTGDGIETEFPILKIYPDAIAPFSRPIYRAVEDTIVVLADGVVVPAADYQLNSGGIIEFDNPPLDTVDLTVSGEFDVPVQFQVDALVTRMHLDGVGEIPDLPVMEVRE